MPDIVDDMASSDATVAITFDVPREIAKIAVVGPDDVLVIAISQRVTDQEADELNKKIKADLDCRVLILDGVDGVAVIERRRIEEL